MAAAAAARYSQANRAKFYARARQTSSFANKLEYFWPEILLSLSKQVNMIFVAGMCQIEMQVTLSKYEHITHFFHVYARHFSCSHIVYEVC